MLGTYPSLTTHEFEIACDALEQRCHNRLEGTNWQSVRWTGQDLQITQRKPSANDDMEQDRGALDSARGSDELEEILEESGLDDGELVVSPDVHIASSSF